MSQAQAPGAQFQTKQLVKVNLVTGALSELSSSLPVVGTLYLVTELKINRDELEAASVAH